jgi:hypothetical protein
MTNPSSTPRILARVLIQKNRASGEPFRLGGH